MVSNLTKSNSLREWIDSKEAHKLFLLVIVINALSIALQTSPYLNNEYGGVLRLIEDITIGLFTLEVVIRLWALRSRFLRDGWNIFDIIVIGLSLVPHEAGFSVLRCFRVLKSLSMFETNLKINHVVRAVNKVWGQVFAALLLMGLSFFILGVMGVELYGAQFPEYFGDLGWSIFTLFMLMQSDGYGDISKEVIEVFPLAWIYFVSVTVILAFIMMNLFVGIVVDAMQGFVEEETQEKLDAEEEEEADQAKQLILLNSELKEIKKALKDLSIQIDRSS